MIIGHSLPYVCSVYISVVGGFAESRLIWSWYMLVRLSVCICIRRGTIIIIVDQYSDMMSDRVQRSTLSLIFSSYNNCH